MNKKEEEKFDININYNNINKNLNQKNLLLNQNINSINKNVPLGNGKYQNYGNIINTYVNTNTPQKISKPVIKIIK